MSEFKFFKKQQANKKSRTSGTWAPKFDVHICHIKFVDATYHLFSAKCHQLALLKCVYCIHERSNLEPLKAVVAITDWMYKRFLRRAHSAPYGQSKGAILAFPPTKKRRNLILLFITNSFSALTFSCAKNAQIAEKQKSS